VPSELAGFGAPAPDRVLSRASQQIILAIDSAGSSCSVVVAAAGEVLSLQRMTSAQGAAEALLPMIDAAMRSASLPPASLNLVCVTVGPGSFTGIRVGLAAARGIALATGARLLGVTGFEAVAANFSPSDYDPAGRLLVALESRREDLYIQAFDQHCHPLGEPASVPPSLLPDVVSRTIGSARLLIAGDAAERAALVLLSRSDTAVLGNSSPDAVGVLRAALSRCQRREQADTLRPLYLRPPDVTLPHGRQPANAGRR
jgi:tRNA threonylcarbamoyladenosine biosynthesis protein TsaB